MVGAIGTCGHPWFAVVMPIGQVEGEGGWRVPKLACLPSSSLSALGWRKSWNSRSEPSSRGACDQMVTCSGVYGRPGEEGRGVWGPIS